LFAERWFGQVDPVDEEVLERAIGPVLDVGCGPARHTVALVNRGVLALGVDIARSAIRLAVDRGAPVLRRSVFDPLPGEGTWGTVLLLDGNLGIGPDPVKLLVRARGLLRRGGRVLVETEGPGVATEAMFVAIEDDSDAGEWFEWTRLGIETLDAIAHAAGFDIREAWSREGRWFAHLDAR
jgi:SAM-dependent methyltransferase